MTGTETARTLQRLLTEKGFSVGPIAGQIGVRTLEAITRFERNNNVTLDISRDFKRAFETLRQPQRSTPLSRNAARSTPRGTSK